MALYIFFEMPSLLLRIYITFTNMVKRFVNDWKYRMLIICFGWFAWWILAFIGDYISSTGQSLEVFKHYLADSTYVGIIWASVTPLVIYFAKVISYKNSLSKILIAHLLGSTTIFLLRTLTYAYFTKSHESIEGNFIDYWQTIIGYQFTGNFVIYGLIVMSYYAINWYLDFKDSELRALHLSMKSVQLEHQLTQANLTTLRMQLNPHFLFNTLHSIASLIRLKKNNDAVDTISTLSDLLRTTVYDGKLNMVTIDKEVSFVKKYLSIEQLRFSDRLEVQWDIEEEVLDYEIPNLMLQPIVENALKHGLKDKKDGLLVISIKKVQPNRIVFSISDNGVGLPTTFSLDNLTGVGLKNTLDRLMGTYDSNFEFNIMNREDASGVNVQLTLPISVN